MTKRLFTHDHEWLLVEGDIAKVGITNYAQEQLGDIVFVELPEEGQEINQEETVVVIESVKAAGEINSPVNGEVISVNSLLNEAPETVNSDPLENGWFFEIKLSDLTQLEELMSEEDYQALLDSH